MDATLHPALAESDIKACIKFQRQDYSWSHAYAVRGFTISGYDLNRFAREKGYKAHYSSYSTKTFTNIRTICNSTLNNSIKFRRA